MRLSDDFWETLHGMVLVGTCGSLRFTKNGKTAFGPLFARHGHSISSVQTVERLNEVMVAINHAEDAHRQIEMRRLLRDPTISAEERAILMRVLEL